MSKYPEDGGFYRSIHRELLLGRYAALGVEGAQALVGKIVGRSGGVLRLQSLDLDVGLLEAGSFVECSIQDLADYVFAVDVHDTFSDTDGNQYDFLSHLRLFAEDWNHHGQQ